MHQIAVIGQLASLHDYPTYALNIKLYSQINGIASSTMSIKCDLHSIATQTHDPEMNPYDMIQSSPSPD